MERKSKEIEKMIKYNVNKEKGTVVAHFDGGKEYIKECIYDRMCKLTDYDFNNSIDGIVEREFVGLDSSYFVGKSKVNFDAGDKFDLEIGKIMAHDRLLNKYHKLEKRIADNIIKVVKREAIEKITRLARV